MPEAVRVIFEHPLTAMTLCFVLLLVLYFICKKLIKLSLAVLIAALVIGGYFYFQHPDQRPVDLKDAMERARDGTVRAVERGKKIVEKGRELVGKGKEVAEKGQEAVGKGKGAAIDRGREIAETGQSFLDKVIERGRAFVDKVKKAARAVGKIFSEESGGDKK